jgi:hypothetical protein
MQAEGDQTAGDLGDDVRHLGVGRMELGSPFQGVGDDLGLGRVDEVPTVGVIIGRSRRRVEVERRLHGVVGAPYRLDGVVEVRGQCQGGGQIIGRDVFLVGIPAHSTLAVVGGIKEVHSRICRLVVVVAPAIEDVLAVAVHIHEEADVAEVIEDPLGVLALRLGKGGGAVIGPVVGIA